MTRLHREDGMTIIELLVAMSMMLVVLFATLGAFDAFTSSGEANSRLTDAQDTARRQVDTMTRALRSATPVAGHDDAILRPAGPGGTNDIIFGTHVEQTTIPRYTRYCVDTTTRTLWYERSTDAGQPDPGAACPSVGNWTRTPLLRGNVRNTSTDPAFSVAADGRAVGIDLRIDGGRDAGSRSVRLRSAAYLRSASGRAPNISGDDIDVTCTTQDGKKVALLELGAGLSESITARYELAGIPIGSGAVKVAADTPVQVAVTVTNILGLQQLLTKQVSC